ncbi:hypothetical protein MAR_034599 [Mya arenaria]|uniref:Uncharacterized protein n=1 Tax=Mya arenaria TaxID=6604 RepID=A0ABY7EHR0_MYAAR|nr:hypothetical protein MAR_034599 [Mya arenaria]
MYRNGRCHGARGESLLVPVQVVGRAGKRDLVAGGMPAWSRMIKGQGQQGARSGQGELD